MVEQHVVVYDHLHDIDSCFGVNAQIANGWTIKQIVQHKFGGLVFLFEKKIIKKKKSQKSGVYS